MNKQTDVTMKRGVVKAAAPDSQKLPRERTPPTVKLGKLEAAAPLATSKAKPAKKK